jgi:hypothetical protein
LGSRVRIPSPAPLKSNENQGLSAPGEIPAERFATEQSAKPAKKTVQAAKNPEVYSRYVRAFRIEGGPMSGLRRVRATKAEVEARREALLEIIAEQQPMSVRQVFYQATVHGVVEKTEAGYSKVQTDLVDASIRRAS